MRAWAGDGGGAAAAAFQASGCSEFIAAPCTNACSGRKILAKAKSPHVVSDKPK
jgi:hypothetical protein